jgi:hypothetical protein
VRRYHTRGALIVVIALPMLAMSSSCTPRTSTTTAAHPANSSQASQVHFAGIDFAVGCAPVAEALTDIELPHHGQPKLRAIAGLWDHEAVAVLANDPDGCGLWTLATADGLSDATRAEIETEAASGVQRFGVTASPVPKQPGD